MKTAVLVSGGGTNMQAIFDAIDEKKITNCEISAVVSSKHEVYALKRAENRGIKTFVVNRKEFDDTNLFSNSILSILKELGVELIVLAGFLSVLSPDFINSYKNKIINVHPALIPSFCGKGYYGMKVHNAVIEYGVKLTGATVHFVNEEVDGGPIIIQKAVPVLDNDTPESLQKRVLEQAEWQALTETVNLICNDRIQIKGRKVQII